LWAADSLENESAANRSHLGSIVAPPIAVGRDPESVAVGPSAVWVVNKLDATLTRIDTQSNSSGSAPGLRGCPDSVSADASGVWVASTSTHTLAHSDPASEQIVITIKTAAGPVAVALDEDNVWVAHGAAHEIERFNASTDQFVAMYP
jgi:streptogramin lyase